MVSTQALLLQQVFLGLLRGHSVVQASVASDQGQELSPILFCKICGASAHSNARGLQGKCKGAGHPGLKTQRSKLRRGLFPGHTLGNARVGAAHGPTLQMRAVRGPLLEPAPAPAPAAAPSCDTVGDEGWVEPRASAGSVRPRVSGEAKQASRL
eukprot:4907163-Pyramimonas_sp.AAC.1